MDKNLSLRGALATRQSNLFFRHPDEGRDLLRQKQIPAYAGMTVFLLDCFALLAMTEVDLNDL